MSTQKNRQLGSAPSRRQKPLTDATKTQHSIGPDPRQAALLSLVRRVRATAEGHLDLPWGADASRHLDALLALEELLQ